MVSFLLTIENGVQLFHVIFFKRHSCYFDFTVPSWQSFRLRSGSFIARLSRVSLHPLHDLVVLHGVSFPTSVLSIPRILVQLVDVLVDLNRLSRSAALGVELDVGHAAIFGHLWAHVSEVGILELHTLLGKAIVSLMSAQELFVLAFVEELGL